MSDAGDRTGEAPVERQAVKIDSALLDAIRGAGGEAELLRFDVRQRQAVEAAVTQALSRRGRIDVAEHDERSGPAQLDHPQPGGQGSGEVELDHAALVEDLRALFAERVPDGRADVRRKRLLGQCG